MALVRFAQLGYLAGTSTTITTDRTGFVQLSTVSIREARIDTEMTNEAKISAISAATTPFTWHDKINDSTRVADFARIA